ncbi:anthranilate synthase component I family protein [Alkalicoccus urumqiensis]|uniref:anthranilate synthase component I family protein n=1 Tax=Alkalicoccus urumqiensis TaxID=1548213 RepID=UPI001FE0D577|nr:anthranilate synthase component I family protein [Alkalicoccus urumqiensis]
MADQRFPFAETFSYPQRDWYDTYRRLTENEPQHVLMESGRGGRWIFIGVRPWARLYGKNRRLTIEENGTVYTKDGPLLESLRNWLSAHPAVRDPNLPDFQGGLAGQFSYDLIREIESLPEKAEDDLLTADIDLAAFDELYVLDTQEKRRFHIVLETEASRAGTRLDRMREAWQQAEHAGAPPFPEVRILEDPEMVTRSFSEKMFIRAVEKIQEYIAAGDVFQVNLSVRETRPQTTSAEHIYSCLRRLNPSPYMSYFHTPERTYIGASPELLVKVKGSVVSTRPIAGTRSRGKDEAEDAALAATLLENEKERAEHIMLVDLERNDLGRVCRYGSVEVNELMVIEKYSHVQHIVSNVRGEKAPEHDAVDVLAAAFPGGTITGAPKIRTMEIIEELEPVRRGAYTGAMGWIGLDGDMEVNITIRTMIAEAGELHVQAGAGIVIDSLPEAEFQESLKKAKALWRAKEMSEEEQEEQRRIST